MAKFLLLMNYGPAANCDIPMAEWTSTRTSRRTSRSRRPSARSWRERQAGAARGWPVLSWPRWWCPRRGTPVSDDGPFPEVEGAVAGYRMVDIERLERALGKIPPGRRRRRARGGADRPSDEVREVSRPPPTGCDTGGLTGGTPSRACCARAGAAGAQCAGPALRHFDRPRKRSRRRCSRPPSSGRRRGCRTTRAAG